MEDCPPLKRSTPVSAISIVRLESAAVTINHSKEEEEERDKKSCRAGSFRGNRECATCVHTTLTQRKVQKVEDMVGPDEDIYHMPTVYQDTVSMQRFGVPVDRVVNTSYALQLSKIERRH